MFRKLWLLFPFLSFILLPSCSGGQTTEEDSSEEGGEVDTCQVDSLSEVEEVIRDAESSDRLDGSFDDFMFAFARSRKLQAQRVAKPLMLVDAHGEETPVEGFACLDEMAFMSDEFYTVLYGSTHQIEREKEHSDTLISVERINLSSQDVRSFVFEKKAGKWMLVRLQDRTFGQTVLSEFLTFYARFSSDSAFQSASIAQPLHISIPDPDGDEDYVEGTIDPEQWSSFCSEVPGGTISNIRYGQGYGARQVVLQKCGTASGLQELFTFQKEKGTWRLTSYEN